MFELCKRVIESRDYDLRLLLARIDALWLGGHLTDQQRLDLATLAKEKADPQYGVDLIKTLQEQNAAIRELQAELYALRGETPPAAPEYEPGRSYFSGDMVTFQEKIYRCIAPDGSVCTVSPAEYPAWWELCA